MKNKERTMEAIERFIGIVEELRSDHGCPWDKAQTHGSIRMELIEEAYEAAEAMQRFEATGEYENLREELGDLLLHVIMHGVIAEEEGIFTIGDIAEEISAKMIHRHPHVFNAEEWQKQEKKKSWEELKAEEKGHADSKNRPLHQVPASLPALIRAQKLLKKASNHYASRVEKEVSLEQLVLLGLQLGQVEAAWQKEKMMTSMLYHMANIAWQEGINLEKGLMDRMGVMVEALEKE
ncbi:MAG: MazG family protein [Lachnospiraceae bacterium]|nr:MazG family protein [Lachnospiraceae bacterium]